MFSDFQSYKQKRYNFWWTWASVGWTICATMMAEIVLGVIYILATISAHPELESFSMPIAVSLFSTFGGVLATSYVVFKQNKWTRADIGLTINKRTVREYLIGALLGLAMLIGSIAPAWIMGQATFGVANITTQLLGHWLVCGVGFIVQSFFEEYLCRGFILKRLNQRYNIYVAVFWQAVIFMLLHSGNPGMGLIPYLNLFLIGIVFAQVVIITDNLWLASGLHWLWNFAQGCIFGIKVSGLEGMPTLLDCTMNGHHLLTGGDFGIEGALSATIVYVIVIALLARKTLHTIRSKTEVVVSDDTDSTTEAQV